MKLCEWCQCAARCVAGMAKGVRALLPNLMGDASPLLIVIIRHTGGFLSAFLTLSAPGFDSTRCMGHAGARGFLSRCPHRDGS